MNLLDIQPNVVSTGVEGKYFLFYGEPSTRKTTVASQFPNALLLATEIGYSLIPGVHAARVVNWASFRDIVRQLKQDELKQKYKTIVIDTVGLLADMCMAFIADTNGVKDIAEMPWGKGWKDFKKEFQKQIGLIATLGYGIVFIAHSDAKRNDDGQISSAVPIMEKRPKESVIALVDFIFYLQKEEKENGEGTTVFAYSKLPSSFESKTRARHLSPKFEFTFENLEKEIKKAIEKHLELNETSLITEDVVQHHTDEKDIPFEDLKGMVISEATRLTKHENPDVVEAAQNAIISIMKGTRISDAGPTHYDQLIVLKEALYDASQLAE